MDILTKIDRHFPDWNYDHPRMLYSFIRALKPQVCVEVGTYRGYAACYMAQALKENGFGKLYCIDNWSLNETEGKYESALDHFRSNIAHFGLQDRVGSHTG